MNKTFTQELAEANRHLEKWTMGKSFVIDDLPLVPCEKPMRCPKCKTQYPVGEQVVTGSLCPATNGCSYLMPSGSNLKRTHVSLIFNSPHE